MKQAVISGLVALLLLTFGAGAASANTALDGKRAAKLVKALHNGDSAKTWRGFSSAERKLALWYMTPSSVEADDQTTLTSALGANLLAACDSEGMDETCTTGYSEPDAGAEVSGGTPADASSGCYTASRLYGVTYKNPVGMKLFSYQTQPRWCWNGQNVTSFTSNISARVLTWFITFERHIEHQMVIKPPNPLVYYHAVGEFKTCVTRIGCYKTWHPSLHVKATPTYGSFQGR